MNKDFAKISKFNRPFGIWYLTVTAFRVESDFSIRDDINLPHILFYNREINFHAFLPLWGRAQLSFLIPATRYIYA